MFPSSSVAKPFVGVDGRVLSQEGSLEEVWGVFHCKADHSHNTDVRQFEVSRHRRSLGSALTTSLLFFHQETLQLEHALFRTFWPLTFSRREYPVLLSCIF